MIRRLRIAFGLAPITAARFEREYAERSGVSVEWLRRRLTVRRCRCGEQVCEGWQSVTHEHAAEIDDSSKPWVR